MNKHYFLDLLERTIATFVETYVAAVVVLPGDIWAAKNWKIAVGGALASTVKSIFASRVGDKSNASLIPAAAAAGGAAGAAAGGEIGSAVGGTLGGVGDLIGGIVREKESEDG
jgi:hypothetical protein